VEPIGDNRNHRWNHPGDDGSSDETSAIAKTLEVVEVHVHDINKVMRQPEDLLSAGAFEAADISS